MDEPLSTRDVKIAGVTALFRTALANGHFVLSDILDRYAEASGSHGAAFKVAGIVSFPPSLSEHSFPER